MFAISTRRTPSVELDQTLSPCRPRPAARRVPAQGPAHRPASLAGGRRPRLIRDGTPSSRPNTPRQRQLFVESRGPFRFATTSAGTPSQINSVAEGMTEAINLDLAPSRHSG